MFRKYVRNHLADVTVEPGFDTVSEFWYDDAETAGRVGAWLASSAGQVLRNDEAQFMDRARIGACVVDERLLHGPPREFEPGPLRKHACVLAARDGNNERTALSLHAWCDALVQRHGLTVASDARHAGEPSAAAPARQWSAVALASRFVLSSGGRIHRAPEGTT